MGEYSSYKLNVETALDKTFEGLAFNDIVSRPVSALQGIGDKTEDVLKQLGLNTILDLAKWPAFRRARSITTLAETEGDEARVAGSVMNVDMFVKRKYSKGYLRDIAEAPPSALLGVTTKADALLEHLHIRSVRDVAECKYARWAEAMAECADAIPRREARPSAEALEALPLPITPVAAPPPAAFTPAQPASNGSKALTPNSALQALKVEEHKSQLESLNSRLEYYISLIREKEAAIARLEEEKAAERRRYTGEVAALDEQYRGQLAGIQAEARGADAQRTAQLERDLAAVRDELARAAESLAEKDSESLSLMQEVEKTTSELAAMRKHWDASKADLASRVKEVSRLEARAAEAEREKAGLGRELRDVRQQRAGLAAAVEHAERDKGMAVEAAVAAAEAAARRQAEDQTARHFSEVEESKRRAAAEWSAKMAELEAKVNAAKEALERELLGAQEAAAKAETYAAESASELEALRKVHAGLKDRHIQQGIELKKQVAGLEHQLVLSTSSKVQAQEDLERLTRHTGSMVQEIEVYSQLLGSEEQRLGIQGEGPGAAAAGTTPAGAASGRKRKAPGSAGEGAASPVRRMRGLEAAGGAAAGSPAAGSATPGILGSLRKTMRFGF